MLVHPSARKHGVTDADIRHALKHSITEIELSEDRWLVIGTDRAANLLEIIVIITDDDDQMVIHAMGLTDQFKRFLP